MINHGHFTPEMRGFSETPAPAGRGGRGAVTPGTASLPGDHAYDFYKAWTGPSFPRMLEVTIQHANPYYDDSYAVNSENVGPYGDAINKELLPVPREEIPWHRPGLGTRNVRRIDRRMGNTRRYRANFSIPTTTTARGPAMSDAVDFRQISKSSISTTRKNAPHNNGDWKHTPHADRPQLSRPSSESVTEARTSTGNSGARHQGTLRRSVEYLAGRP